MDKITQSLVGVALSETAVRESATPAQRRLFLAAGIVSSNLPDLDLLYVGLTPPPLGYLLHHRGHTHTLVGLVVQGLLGWMLCRLAPAVRRLAAGDRARLFALIVVGLLGHLLLDTTNSYGVHPFYPFDRRWYYGDAVFIFEPWLWLLVGLAAAWNARSLLARTARLRPGVSAWTGHGPQRPGKGCGRGDERTMTGRTGRPAAAMLNPASARPAAIRASCC